MIRILVLDAASCTSGGGSSGCGASLVGKATLQALVSAAAAAAAAASSTDATTITKATTTTTTTTNMTTMTTMPAFEICAAVQDPLQFHHIEGVAKTYALPTNDEDVENKKEWCKLLQPFHRIFLVPPKIQDPVPFTKSILKAAAAAANAASSSASSSSSAGSPSTPGNLELLLLLSNTLAASPNPTTTLVGQQYHILEEYTKTLFHDNNSNNKYCIVRIPSSPLWMDHLGVYGHHIRHYGGALMDPRDPTKPFWSVSVQRDVAKACATILMSPSSSSSSSSFSSNTIHHEHHHEDHEHHHEHVISSEEHQGIVAQHWQKTYNLVSSSSRWNLHDLAKVLSQKLHGRTLPTTSTPTTTTTTTTSCGDVTCDGENATLTTNTDDTTNTTTMMMIHPVRVSYEDTRKGMMSQHNMPEWLVDSVLELFHSIDHHNSEDNNDDHHDDDGIVPGDVERITGEPSMTLEDWIEEHIEQFQ